MSKHDMKKWDHESSSRKMAAITGTHKNYEHAQDKAERLCRGGYNAGGEVDATSDTLPNPFSEIKPVKTPRLPRKPVSPPRNEL